MGHFVSNQIEVFVCISDFVYVNQFISLCECYLTPQNDQPHIFSTYSMRTTWKKLVMVLGMSPHSHCGISQRQQMATLSCCTCHISCSVYVEPLNLSTIQHYILSWKYKRPYVYILGSGLGPPNHPFCTFFPFLQASNKTYSMGLCL